MLSNYQLALKVRNITCYTCYTLLSCIKSSIINFFTTQHQQVYKKRFKTSTNYDISLSMKL